MADRYSSTKEFLIRYPKFKSKRLISLLRHRKTNGLEDSGAIKKYFHTIYINETLFIAWLQSKYK